MLYGKYQNLRDAAWRCLLEYEIDQLPVDVLKITKSSGIHVIKDSSVKKLKSQESGISLFDGETWYIIYNNREMVQRCRFTIAHELGHIFLGHPLKLGYHARTIDSDEAESEMQADMFAARLLCPACVLWGLNLHTPNEISRFCNVSYAAAKKRAARMQVLYERNKFLTSPLEREVYKKFCDYIKDNRVLHR